LLDLCLRSVELYRPQDCEVIVVDDGSKDAVVSETATRFPYVTVIRISKARGFAAAANAAAALERFSDPGVDAVAPLPLIHPASSYSRHPLVDSAGDVYDLGGFATKRGHGERLAAKHVVPGPCGSVCATAGFYRRDALLRVGGFAESFGAYFEDVDLSLRLHSAGGRLAYEPRSVVWHHVSASYLKSPSRRTLERQSCNEERLFWRHPVGNPSRRDWPRHMLVLAAKIQRRQSENQLAPWITGRIQFGWNALLSRRHCAINRIACTVTNL
jgi:GT2 family glycosyltransferase